MNRFKLPAKHTHWTCFRVQIECKLDEAEGAYLCSISVDGKDRGFQIVPVNSVTLVRGERRSKYDPDSHERAVHDALSFAIGDQIVEKELAWTWEGIFDIRRTG